MNDTTWNAAAFTAAEEAAPEDGAAERAPESAPAQDATGAEPLAAEIATDPREQELLDALRIVVDPEIGLDVVALGLIRGVEFRPAETEVTMILTTPFCPYGGMLIQQVKDVTQAVFGGVAIITLGEEIWSPEMMEGGDWAEWGLV